MSQRPAPVGLAILVDHLVLGFVFYYDFTYLYVLPPLVALHLWCCGLDCRVRLVVGFFRGFWIVSTFDEVVVRHDFTLCGRANIVAYMIYWSLT